MQSGELAVRAINTFITPSPRSAVLGEFVNVEFTRKYEKNYNLL